VSIFGSIVRGLGGAASSGAVNTRSSSGFPASGLISAFGSVPSASGLPISQATAMTVSAVYCAVTTIATDVARCAPQLYQLTDDGGRRLVRHTEHPVARLLRAPNRLQTWFEWARDITIALELRGNGYAAILRDSKGHPTELILINPDAVTVLEALDGSIFYNVNRLGLFQLSALQDFPVAIPAEDILHLRGPSFNMLVGASTIGLARDAIGLAIGQSQQQSRWVGNGAKPSGVLEANRRLDDAAAKRLKNDWETFQSGLQNVGRTAVLEEGVTFKAMSLTAVDLEFINQVNLTVQDVARFWRMPPRKLMQPDTSRGSTIIQEEQAYVNASVAPRLQQLEEKFDQMFDLESRGFMLDLNEDALLRADPLTRYNIGRTGILTGMISPNEWRRGERLPPVEGGDALLRPLNMAALGSDLTGTAPDAAGRPSAGENPAPGVPNVKITSDDVAPEG